MGRWEPCKSWVMQVASWWDYGYQTTAMANRTVIVDNNTWNNTHIATVGASMRASAQLCRRLCGPTAHQ